MRSTALSAIARLGRHALAAVRLPRPRLASATSLDRRTRSNIARTGRGADELHGYFPRARLTRRSAASNATRDVRERRVHMATSVDDEPASEDRQEVGSDCFHRMSIPLRRRLNGHRPARPRAAEAMIVATMPSMRSVLRRLLGLMLPAASVSIATLLAIQRRTGFAPWRSCRRGPASRTPSTPAERMRSPGRTAPCRSRRPAAAS
jgi:hypothetical protein